MGGMRSWIVRPVQGLLAIFDVRVVRASAHDAQMAQHQAFASVHQSVLEKNLRLEEKNLRLEAQMAGFCRVMEQDYRLIHDLFQEDRRLTVGD